MSGLPGTHFHTPNASVRGSSLICYWLLEAGVSEEAAPNVVVTICRQRDMCDQRSSLVGRCGLEPNTSAIERPESCADDIAEIKVVERQVGRYVA